MRRGMKTALAVRHVPFEDLGAFESALARRGYAVRYAEAGEPLREERLEDIVIVLGGPISANDEARYPFLREELLLIERRLKRGAAVMGVCLGAQLLARALGARVYPGSAREIGLAPITLTADGQDSCLSAYAHAPLVLHWHGDTFDLPRGAQLLASTDVTPHQAFSFGPNAVALQFHAEIQPARFERWLVGHAVELDGAGVDVPALRAQMRAEGAALERKGVLALEAWLDNLDVVATR
jgi:GMP synthase (glutamine-hydrolysing)